VADDGLSRRDLLLFWRRRSEPPNEPAPAPAPEPMTFPTPPPARTLPPLRPPGLHDLAACTHSGGCITACPAQAIFAGEDGTPVIDARRSPCVVCDGLLCTHACPSGALSPIDDRLAIRMGTAVVDTAWCLAHRGVECRSCVDVCPIPGALVPERGPTVYLPRVDPERCIGCGLCEHFCPTKPAAIFVDSELLSVVVK
jgi:ferredoxin